MKKTRLWALLMLVCILTCALPLSAVGEESGNELLELFKTDYEVTGVRYDGFYENKYVSEDGQTEKWYCSHLPEIDGLKRTEEQGDRIYPSDAAQKACDIKERHAHLYANYKQYMLPFYSEAESMIINTREWKKTSIVTQIDEKAKAILLKFDLVRLSDNATYLQVNIDDARKYGFKGLAHMVPIELTEDSIVLRVVPYYESEANYTEDMNGYLIYNNANTVTDEFETLTEEEKYITLKVDENGRITESQK